MRNSAIRIGLCLLAFGTSICAFAQKEDDAVLKQRIIEQRIEAIVENLDEGVELDYTTLFDEFSYYLEHPLNLNKADELALRQLYLLTEQQIYSLFEHIQRFGPLRELYELQAVKGWNVYTINLLLPFVKVSEGSAVGGWSFKDVVKDGTHDWFIRYSRILEEQQGYAPISDEELADNPNARYLGSPDRVYTRYRFRYRNNLSIGLTAEKDAGEEFFAGSQRQGFDYMSGHVYYEDKGFLRKAVVGDYQAQFGQGLTLWSGLGFGKSPFITNAKRNAIGLRPYTSVDENLFFRGAAATFGHKNLEFTALYSTKGVDASVSARDTLDSEEVQFNISSFQLSGLHRTPRELDGRNAVREQHFGGNMQWRSRRLSVGLSALQTFYGATVERNLRVYNQFEFNSNQNFVAGLNYSYLWRNLNFFGEVSRSASGGVGTVNGLIAALDQRLSLVIMQRHFTRDFQSIYANAFAERSRPTNESGIYFGMEFRPARNWQITGYADHFRFPWLSYLLDAPSSGHEYLLQTTYKPTRKSEFYVRLRKRTKGRNQRDSDARLNEPVFWTQEFLRVNAVYEVHPNVTLKSRVEFTRYQLDGNSPEHGFIAYQDVVWKKIGAPWNLSLRYALFDIESFNARLYAFENDVLYFFSIPAYQNRGSRFYVMSKIKLRRGMDLWLRYSRWMYIDRETIGSGLEEVDGNVRSDVRVQLRVQF